MQRPQRNAAEETAKARWQAKQARDAERLRLETVEIAEARRVEQRKEEEKEKRRKDDEEKRRKGSENLREGEAHGGGMGVGRGEAAGEGVEAGKQAGSGGGAEEGDVTKRGEGEGKGEGANEGLGKVEEVPTGEKGGVEGAGMEDESGMTGAAGAGRQTSLQTKVGGHDTSIVTYAVELSTLQRHPDQSVRLL